MCLNWNLCYLILLFQRIANKWIRHEAHISYAYKSVELKSPTERIITCKNVFLSVLLLSISKNKNNVKKALVFDYSSLFVC